MSKLLVVDDEPTIRTLLVHFFRDEGFEVETSPDGHLGYQRAISEPFDVVIMDLAMPGWDGVTAIESLAIAMPDTKILVYSGYITEAIERRFAGRSNIVGLVKKPLGLRLLRSAVGQALACA